MNTLEQVSKVFSYLLPIFAVAVLLVILILVIKVLGIIKKLGTTVTSANKSLDIVNGYLGDLNTTVRTVNNVSMSVEAVRVTASNLIAKLIKKWTDEYESVKKLLTSILEKVTANAKQDKAVKDVTIVENEKNDENVQTVEVVKK